jgi:ATP-dependent DNA helicase HFM1/MER3
MRENPEHYCIDGNNNVDNLENRLERICNKDIDLLRENNLVQGDNRLSSTEFGDAIARYCVSFETAKGFLSLPTKAKVSEIVSFF